MSLLLLVLRVMLVLLMFLQCVSAYLLICESADAMPGKENSIRSGPAIGLRRPQAHEYGIAKNKMPASVMTQAFWL
jgi:hypothetical protein